MKNWLSLLLIMILYSTAVGQTENPVCTEMDKNEILESFGDEFKYSFDVNYPIIKAWSCSDHSGWFNILLTEENDRLNDEGEKLNSHLRGYNFYEDHGGFLKKWEINDFIIKGTDDKFDENTIFFWAKYCDFTDINRDGFIDPIIVYGTTSEGRGTGDGRIKILIYYKGNETTIHHKNSIFDDSRNTRVDEAFYNLPQIIIEKVTTIMDRIEEDGYGIFPNTRKEAMKNRKLYFDEN